MGAATLFVIFVLPSGQQIPFWATAYRTHAACVAAIPEERRNIQKLLAKRRVIDAVRTEIYCAPHIIGDPNPIGAG